jgi:hypothetical protein
MPVNYMFALIGAGLVIFGLYQAYKVYTVYRRLNASQAWQVANGQITATTIRFTSGGNNRGNSGRHYLAQFTYTFSVMGSTFNGGFSKDSILGLKGSAEKEVQAHPTGSAVSVRYNQDNPQECVSEYDKVNATDLVYLVVSILLGGLVIYQSHVLNLLIK